MKSIKTTEGSQRRNRANTVETTSRDLENSIMLSSSNMPTPKPKINNTALKYIQKNEGEPEFDPESGATRVRKKRKSSGGSRKSQEHSGRKKAWTGDAENSILGSPEKDPKNFEGKEPELELIQGTHGQGGLPLFKKGNSKECHYCLRRDLPYVLVLENCNHGYCPHCLL